MLKPEWHCMLGICFRKSAFERTAVKFSSKAHGVAPSDRNFALLVLMLHMLAVFLANAILPVAFPIMIHL